MGGGEIFLAQGQDDARALCFAAFVDEDEAIDVARMRRSAEMGYPFAQVLFAGELLMSGVKDLAFQFASQAALQGDREGFNILGTCLRYGLGCERNLEEAKKNFLLAAKMQLIEAADQIGDLLDESDPQRWRWLGLAAKEGMDYKLRNGFFVQVLRFETDPSLGPVVFL